MSVIHEEAERKVDLRSLTLLGVLAAGLALLFLRLWYLQVVQADSLREKGKRVGVTQIKTLAPRGLIVDRHGSPLAGVRSELVVTALPRPALGNLNRLKAICGLVGAPYDRTVAKLKENVWRPFVPTPIAMDVPVEIASRIAELRSDAPEFDVAILPMRVAAADKGLSHVLGYVWTPSERDVKRISEMGKKPADYVGKVGLEFVHEAELMGLPGTDEIEVDAKRRPIRLLSREAAVPGSKLILGLDANLQHVANEQLQNRRGAIVALDPSTGEVLCLASAPDYDAGLFRGGISTADYRMLADDPAKPLFNRAIAASYAPGSTFKIVTALASQLSGKFSASRHIFCPGFLTMGNRKFRCLGRHGSIPFATAFEKSCNVYFSTLAVEAGPEALREACKQVGLGTRTGVDLFGESGGIVPTMEWIAKWRKPPVWYGGDTVNFGIGQGELSVTPIQMAQVAMMAANRGIAYRPHFVRSIQVPISRTTQLVPLAKSHEAKATDEFWTEIQRAMKLVIQSGTARGSQIPGVEWCGKTGSAENRRNRETHSWFVGFAPADNPRIAIAVVVENAGHGGEVAAPIARNIVQTFLKGQSPVLEKLARTSSVRAAAASSPN